MARPVKCTICKLEGDSDTFIRIPKLDKGNWYFCSDSHVKEYEYRELENRKRKWILNTIAKLIKYDETKQFPNSINKELKRIRGMYEYDVIYKCLCDGANTIEWRANNGGWDTDWGMTRYIFHIIEGGLNDTVKAMNHDEMLMERVKEQANKLVDISIINEVDVVTVVPKSKNKSIADMLDEEDLL